MIYIYLITMNDVICLIKMKEMRFLFVGSFRVVIGSICVKVFI